MASRTNSQFDEKRWIIQIRQTIEEEDDDESNDIPVSIFCVPKNLMLSDPDFYVPQQIALGPYHHCRVELVDMDRYKLDAAKMIQKQLHNKKFQNLVSQLSIYEPMIRAVYHKYIDFSSETLMWIMSVDASFLLEFLQTYAARNEGKIIGRVPSRLSYLVDFGVRNSSHNAILRDMIMLENQIPLFLLRKILELQYTSLELADRKLLPMLMGFCHELSPFKILDSGQQMMECAHLLDFLYNLIIPTKSDPVINDDAEDDNGVKVFVPDESSSSKTSFGKSTHVKKLLDEVWKVLSKLKDGPVRLIKKFLFSRPLKVLLKFPWAIISSIPVIRVIKEPIEYLLFSEHKQQEEKTESKSQVNKPPLMEEISIPSVTELAKAGVKFLPANEGDGILSISFDTKNATFYLPTINLDVNSEVVLRNLVAYEACNNASRFLVFTRYTEMMNGIIDNEDDAKFLREKGIIFNRLKSDLEVANLWNGMSRAVRLTKVPFLDKAIEDVNKYYNRKWKVKIGKFMKRYVFESWKFLTLIAAVILLLLMTVQAFCSVYNCSRIFHVKQVL